MNRRQRVTCEELGVNVGPMPRVSSGVHDSGAKPAADKGGLAESGAKALAGFAGATNVNSYGGVTCRLGSSNVFFG